MRKRIRNSKAIGLGAAVAALTLLAPVLSHAADTPMIEGAPGRFTMHPADGGFIRLDTQSGQISMCARKDAKWSCESLPDERVGLQKEIDRLAARNKELETSVKQLEDIAGIGADQPAKKSGPMIGLPSEEDVDKALSYAQRMLKKFKDKIKELEGSGKGTTL